VTGRTAHLFAHNFFQTWQNSARKKVHIISFTRMNKISSLANFGAFGGSNMSDRPWGVWKDMQVGVYGRETGSWRLDLVMRDSSHILTSDAAYGFVTVPRPAPGVVNVH
jgi:hypothetical protein